MQNNRFLRLSFHRDTSWSSKLNFLAQHSEGRRFLHVFLLLLTGLSLAACTGSKNSSTINLPEWIVEIPKDDLYYYQVGTGSSKERSLAREKARFNGEIAIAKFVGERVVGLQEALTSIIPPEDTEQASMYFNEVQSYVEKQRITEVSISEIHFEWVDEQSMVRCYLLTRIPKPVAHTLIKTATEKVFLQQPELWSTIADSKPFIDF